MVAVAFTAMAAMAGIAAWYFSGQLSKVKEAKLGTFQQESRLAIASADARAAEANEKASEAAEGTATALSDAASANERAGRIELEAAEQRERAAKAERDLLALQEQLAWRVIDDQHATALVTRLSMFAGQSVWLFPIAGNEEISRLSQQLAAILKKAGLIVKVTPGTLFGPAKSGFSFVVGEDRMALADSLSHGLAEAGVATLPIRAERSATRDVLTVYIWPK